MATAMNATSTFSCPHNGTAHDGTFLCHWSSGPGAQSQGTLDIFWLCIPTLALCVWNAVHPDIPRPKTPWWRVFGKRVWMLFVGLFMPEMLVLVALGQLRLAWQLLFDVDRTTRCPTEFPWWMYLVKRPENGNPDSPLRRWMARRLPCLRVRSRSDSDAEKGQSVPPGENDPSPPGAVDAPAHDSSKSSDTSQQAHNSPRPADSHPEALARAIEHPWTLTHSFYAVMNGFVDGDGDAINIDDIPRRLGLDPERITNIIAIGIAPPLDDRDRIPDVSVEDIDDRGKAGVLAKSLLVWQFFVFLANCFARWDQSLPLSLLEITTIGHSLCSIIAMVLWWYKPHSIGEATVIGRNRPLPSLSNMEWGKIISWSFLKGSFYAARDKVLAGDGNPMDLPKTVTIAAIAVLYGLPHLLGLSVHFPTFAEQLCWTIATFTVIGSPLVMCGIFWIVRYTENLGRMEDTADSLLAALLYILLVLYPIASMFLVGESVRQIFALPVESFREPQLTSYLPSFS